MSEYLGILFYGNALHPNVTLATSIDYRSDTVDLGVWSGSIQATSWENLFMPYANNKGVDQPVHLCSLISAFIVCCLDSIIPLASFCSWAGRFQSDLVANPEGRFSYYEAHTVCIKHRNVCKMWCTVKILNIRTPEKFAVITLKFE